MKQINRLLNILLVLTLVFTFLTPIIHAAEDRAELRAKDEVVYARLTANGASEAAYIVNVFEVIKKGEIVDYGNYSAVKNLTDLSAISKGAEQVEFSAGEGKFYYQGNLDEIQLPWDVAVTYYLDGEEIAPEELLGQDGKVEIKIETKANKSVDSVFFDHYTLQITLPLAGEKFSHIQAEDATIAKVGKTEQVTLTILPEEASEQSVTANVKDFEMEGIEIVAIPFMMALEDFETDDMVDNMSSLSDAIAEVHEGVGTLNDGVLQLSDGTNDVEEGSAQFHQGLIDLNSASTSLVHGSGQIKAALARMKKELSFVDDIDLSELQELIDGLEKMELGLREIADGLNELAGGYATAFDKLNNLVEEVPNRDEELELTKEEMGLMIVQGISQEKIEYLMRNYEAAQTLKEMFNNEGFLNLFNSIESILQQSSDALHEIADRTLEMTESLNGAWKEFSALDQLDELVYGLNEFVTQYDSFHKGLVAYTKGVKELTTVSGDLHGGINELTKGTDELSSGTTELHEGTSELRAETATLPEEMQAEIDEYLETYDHSEFEAKSFISEKNKQIGLVQFIINTEAIKYSDSEEEEEKAKEKKGIWQKIKSLFTKES